MAGTTTNNAWAYPTSTDYVKDGATAIQTLASAIDTSVGTGLLAWQTWAPTFSGGWTNGNGTWTARYVQLGKTVHVAASFTIGSTTSKGTTMTVSLPVTMFNAGLDSSLHGRCNIAGTVFTLQKTTVTTTTVTLGALAATGSYVQFSGVTSAIPAAWATGDTIIFGMTYQAA
jgi:hypothetical protein